MSTSKSISEVAAETGLTAHTIRYYEREGIMRPVSRDGAGVRRFDADAVEWLILLTHLRETGMPIVDMRRFADLVVAGPESVPDRLTLLRAHHSRLVGTIADLERARAALEDKIAIYAAGLATTPSPEPRP